MDSPYPHREYGDLDDSTELDHGRLKPRTFDAPNCVIPGRVNAG